ncbi:MAG TPA: hypothetical protein VN969_22845 [Streptosporangiaceae bacterium]|nr:hypothetical protein [Streptosporangiaceae bacterium]
MIVLPFDAALLRAVFPDWQILAQGPVWHAARRPVAGAGSGRLEAVGQPELTASTPAALAIQLATLECPLGITPVS